jgi:Uma2 family endonuclease
MHLAMLCASALRPHHSPALNSSGAQVKKVRMMTAQPNISLTASQYFHSDQRSNDRLEYFYGTIVAQAGATARHNTIVSNVIGHLFPQLRRQDCRIYPSDLRIQAIDQHVYTYPNLTIVCGPPQFLEPNELTLINPTIIMEILSPSTDAKDRSEKLVYYRSIDSLQEYILIDQNSPYVQRYARQTAHFWYVHLIDTLEEVITLEAVGVTLPMDAIYDRIVFPSEV